MKARIHYVDGSQSHVSDFCIDYSGRWVKAIDSETHKLVYIPSSQILKCMEV